MLGDHVLHGVGLWEEHFDRRAVLLARGVDDIVGLLRQPSRIERKNARLGIDLPTKEDMEEIEISSRLYQEDGAVFMTAILPAHTDGDDPQVAPVTFVLAGDRLITVRYHEPRAFQTFATRAEKAAREARIAEEMRSNLRKRKAQQRARREDGAPG